MLSRRLEAQMTMINSVPSSSTPTKNASNGASTLSPANSNITKSESGNEEAAQERERTIIKAALSIAEICMLPLFTRALFELT